MNMPTIPGTISDSAAVPAIGDLRVCVLEADMAPATLGGTYQKIHAAAINDSGDLAFVADLAGPPACSAIFLTSGDSIQVIVRSGAESPCGGRYRAFGELDLGDDAFLLFRAELESAAGLEGLFLWTPAGVRLVARSGGRSPRGGIYRSFDQLTLNARAYDTGPFFVLAFRATMQDGARSVIVEPCYAGAAREPLATGDRLGKDVVDDIAISQLGFALCCVIDVRRSKQRFKKAVIVHEATVVHADALRERRQVPGLGQITRLLVPPAANMQASVVALEFKGGRSGLALAPILSDPELFAKTGDPAPGLPNQCIQSFGPPVSNNGVLPASLFGVVSRVRLSGGPAALWVGVFTQQIPLGGEAIVPLIEGDSIDDRPDLIVREFTPLKLTNSGMLLLRATLQQGGANREGLLLLDGLFDWLA